MVFAMTNVAYLLFSFLACLFGLGFGLLFHHVWSKAQAASGHDDGLFSSSTDDTASFDAYTKWQSDNNRRFAWQVSSCGAAPVILACAAWTQRSDVVHSVCSSVIHIVGQAYICT
jgi:hypothetical protein